MANEYTATRHYLGPDTVNTYPAIKMEGLKYDQDKPRTDLLDPEFLMGVSSVLAFGARKYAANNWRGGIAYSRIIGAILRHTFAIMRGEDADPESGLPHVDHLGCNVMFLSWHLTHKKELDDRYKHETSKSLV